MVVDDRVAKSVPTRSRRASSRERWRAIAGDRDGRGAQSADSAPCPCAAGLPGKATRSGPPARARVAGVARSRGAKACDGRSSAGGPPGRRSTADPSRSPTDFADALLFVARQLRWASDAVGSERSQRQAKERRSAMVAESQRWRHLWAVAGETLKSRRRSDRGPRLDRLAELEACGRSELGPRVHVHPGPPGGVDWRQPQASGWARMPLSRRPGGSAEPPAELSAVHDVSGQLS